MLTPLEKEVLDMLLDKSEEPYATIKQQLSQAVVTKREFTGVGFYTHFKVPTGQSIRYDLPDMTIGDVGAELSNLLHGAGFLLFIRHGIVEILEGYTYDEPWPTKIDQFKVFKLPTKQK
jgi:hypothetical protein